MPLKEPWSFESWIAWVFDRPEENLDWGFSAEPPPETAIDFLTELFTAPRQFIGRFSDAQINQGLTVIMHAAWSDHAFVFLNEQISLPKRIKGIHSFEPLFSELYAFRCTNTLMHLNEPGANPLNSSCYQWWDSSPFHGGREGEHNRAIDEACLDVMQAVLSLANHACQESALYGLGQYSHYEPHTPRCRSIISRYLRTAANLRPELHSYAEQALKGEVF
jgi:hypothetical protein